MLRANVVITRMHFKSIGNGSRGADFVLSCYDDSLGGGHTNVLRYTVVFGVVRAVVELRVVRL